VSDPCTFQLLVRRAELRVAELLAELGINP
jgi:hypothetical protein